MIITGPRVTEKIVAQLLKEHNINLDLCNKGTHYSLGELTRKVQSGEIELISVEKGHRLEIKQRFVIVRVLHVKPNLSVEELYETCTIFYDGSRIRRHAHGLSGIHNNQRPLEATAREVVFQSIGQSEPRFTFIKRGRFTKKQDRNETLVTDRSHVWYGIRVVVEKIHFDLIIPRFYYKEEYTKRVIGLDGKTWKTTYFSWRAVSGVL